MIKIMTEDKNLTLKLSKEESDELFSQLALILLNHTKEKVANVEIPHISVPKINPPKINPPKVNLPKFSSVKSEEIKYSGFLYIKCEHCGATKGFCAKTPISSFKCDECGERTEFSEGNMIPMYVECVNCSSHFKYTTNVTDESFTYNCLNCESPIDLVYNDRRNQFNNLSE